jgi:hypothetical protein
MALADTRLTGHNRLGILSWSTGHTMSRDAGDESFRAGEPGSVAQQDDDHGEPTRAGYVLALVSAVVMLGAAVPIVTWRNPETGRPLPRLVAVTAAALAGAACYGVGSVLLRIFGIRVWVKGRHPGSATQEMISSDFEGYATTGDGSPQAVFDRAAAAATREDWQTFYHCIEPGDANLMRLSLWAWAIFVASGNKELEPQLADLLARHRSTGDAAENVHDSAAFFADLMAFLKQVPGYQEACPFHPCGTLHDLSIEGASARGTFRNAAGALEPVCFVEHANRWYLTLESRGEADRGSRSFDFSPHRPC